VIAQSVLQCGKQNTHRYEQEQRQSVGVSLDDLIILTARIFDMSCEDQALVSTEICVRWGCDKAKLELMNTFWTCPVCRASYGAEAKIGLLSYEYVNRFGIEVDVLAASDSSGQYEMINVTVDGEPVDKNVIDDGRMLVGDLVEEIHGKDEEITTLKEANAWLRSLRKPDMP